VKRRILLKKLVNALAYVAAWVLNIIKWLIFITQQRALRKIINPFAYIAAGVLVIIIGDIVLRTWVNPPRSLTPTPTEEPQLPTLSSVPPSNTTNSIEPIVLLEEDFENCQDITSKFEDDGGRPWLCANGVYETSNLNESTTWANINFISSEDWSDYAVEYCVRIPDFKPNPDNFQVALAIRRDPNEPDDSKGTDYSHVFSLTKKQTELIYSEGGEWLNSLGLFRNKEFRTGQWYSFRVQAQGGLIQVFYNGHMIINKTDYG
jgi:hypothetical protein